MLANDHCGKHRLHQPNDNWHNNCKLFQRDRTSIEGYDPKTPIQLKIGYYD